MEVKLIYPKDLSDIENHLSYCAGICYDKHESSENRLKGVMKKCHWSVLSHASASFEISGISRACSQQLVRHAHLRYMQLSQRYVRMENPNIILTDQIKEVLSNFNLDINQLNNLYKLLIDNGIPKEDARLVLPIGISTQMIISGNFQAWFDFLRLRLDSHAQWEIRNVAKEIYKILNTNLPNIFNKENLLRNPSLNLEI